MPSSPTRRKPRSCLWIPILLCLFNELSFAEAESSTILLPSQQHNADSVSTTFSAHCPAPDPSLNYRPVIGILSHPGDGASGRLSNATNASYIAASYVKFVESGGARVIPLIFNEPEEILFEKLELVNGILYTGGWAKNGLYYDIVEKIFKKILEKNDAGDHFPVYAICLGFELLSMIVSEDRNILETFDGANQASTLQFVKNINIEGTLFQRFPPELLKKLSTDCLVMQNHHYGISPERMQANQELAKFFKILTTSVDEYNKVYVSTVQAYNYPVTAFQWHPEAKLQFFIWYSCHVLHLCGQALFLCGSMRIFFCIHPVSPSQKNAFEWGPKAIPHTEDAIRVTQQAANFFISEARKSSNRPPARKVLDNLIYNYSPTYCGKAGKGYDEVYIFT